MEADILRDDLVLAEIVRRLVAPTISWGAMLAEGQTFLGSAPWVAVFPGLALMLAVLGVNLLGDGLRDLLDPRFRAS